MSAPTADSPPSDSPYKPITDLYKQIQGHDKLKKVDFGKIHESSIDDILSTHKFLYTSQVVRDFEKKSERHFREGLQGIVEAMFKADFGEGNFGKITDEAARKKKIDEFLRKIMEHALVHYQSIGGYSSIDKSIIQHPEKDLTQWNRLINDMFGELPNFRQMGGVPSWEALVDFFDDRLSDTSFDMNSMFDNNEQAQELYQRYFGSLAGYATSHLEGYRSTLESHMRSTKDDSRVKKIKEHANTMVKKYAPKVDDAVGGLELDIEKAGFTNREATSLLQQLYLRQLSAFDALAGMKKYIKGGSKAYRTYVTKGEN